MGGVSVAASGIYIIYIYTCGNINMSLFNELALALSTD